MKYVIAPIALSFASFALLAQDPGEPPIKVSPPALEEIAPRPDAPPKKKPLTEDPHSQVVPARPKIQPKPIEEQEIEIEAPPIRRPSFVEIENSNVKPMESKQEVVPARARPEIKPVEEDEIKIEVPQPRRRPNRVHVDISELEPVRAEQLPKNLDVPKVEPLPSPPSPRFPEDPAIAPVPNGALIGEQGPRPGKRPLYIDLQTINYSIPGINSLLGAPPIQEGHWVEEDMLQYRVSPNSAFQFDGAFRGYFRDDQRIKWSGLESTFGGEGVLRPSFVSRTGDWIVSTQGEFFLSQRFGTSILSDPDRDLFDSNFDVEAFQIFQLFVEAKYDDLSVRMGRSRTPFGRYQSPMYTNAMVDAPFIRTEVIGFLETGIFFRYAPSPFVVDLAIVNGEPDLDTNSSKAVVTRWGIEEPTWTAGISAKIQDGISSEFQKRYNNVFGIDGSVSLGRWLIYGEAVLDQYGFLRDVQTKPDYDPYQLGIRSLYSRDIFKGDDKAINGKGAYLGVTYRADNWLVDLSCGRYVPEKLGNAAHDKPINRVLLKTSYMAARNLEVYLLLLGENKREPVGNLTNVGSMGAWFGMQYGF